MQNQPYNISSPAVSPEQNPAEYKDIYYQLEQMIGADVERLKNLVQYGIVSDKQGAYLLAQLQDKALKINRFKELEYLNRNASNQPVPENPAPLEKEDAMALFNSERPGFFDQAGRGDVLNYIKDFDMGKDEIEKIAKIVECLEN